MAAIIRARTEDGKPKKEDLDKLEKTVKELSDLGFDVFFTNTSNVDMAAVAVSKNKKLIQEFVSLPEHLRTTAIALYKIGKGIARDISLQTSKSRAVESGYLKQLEIMGYAETEKDGSKVVYKPSQRLCNAIDRIF